VHGNHKGLQQVFQECKFDYDKDYLIILGDVVDGWPGCNPKRCVTRLLKVKSRILIRGNHDQWFMDFMDTCRIAWEWYSQGGKETLYSYGYREFGINPFNPKVPRVRTQTPIPQSHEKFFSDSVMYHIDNQGRVFVHGGFIPGTRMDKQLPYDLLWDRFLIEDAREGRIKGFKHVFVGHTSTQTFGRYPEIKDCLYPVTFNNLTVMDTGAGSAGKVSIMDIDTREVWQSSKDPLAQEPARGSG